MVGFQPDLARDGLGIDASTREELGAHLVGITDLGRHLEERFQRGPPLDPQGHVAIDASGMLKSASGSPVIAARVRAKTQRQPPIRNGGDQ